MSTIIKANASHAERSSVGAVAYNFDDMTGKANAYLQQVKAEAAQIIAKANQESQQIRKQAQEQGTRAAHESAEKNLQSRIDSQVKQQMQTALPALQQLTRDLQAARLEWLQQWEQNAVTFALAVAEKIIRREVTHQPAITLQLVREALELASGSQQVKVYLHPQDHQALGKQVVEIARQLSNLAPTDILPDDRVSPGGCLVHTEFGHIDQQIESQLARVAEELA
jgi:flagellar assembly protein FliH